MSEMHRCKLNMRPEAFCFKIKTNTAYQTDSKVLIIFYFLFTLPPSYPSPGGEGLAACKLRLLILGLGSVGGRGTTQARSPRSIAPQLTGKQQDGGGGVPFFLRQQV